MVKQREYQTTNCITHTCLMPLSRWRSWSLMVCSSFLMSFSLSDSTGSWLRRLPKTCFTLHTYTMLHFSYNKYNKEVLSLEKHAHFNIFLLNYFQIKVNLFMMASWRYLASSYLSASRSAASLRLFLQHTITCTIFSTGTCSRKPQR